MKRLDHKAKRDAIAKKIRNLRIMARNDFLQSFPEKKFDTFAINSVAKYWAREAPPKSPIESLKRDIVGLKGMAEVFEVIGNSDGAKKKLLKSKLISSELQFEMSNTSYMQ